MAEFDSIVGPLDDELTKLAPWQAATFCAWCAERLFVNYVWFSELTGWDGANALRAILDSCWELIGAGTGDRVSLAWMARKCEQLAPDTEDFQDSGVSLALDAAVSVACCLDCLIDGTNQGALDASQSAIDTFDQVLGEIAREHHLQDDALESFVCSHPTISALTNDAGKLSLR